MRAARPKAVTIRLPDGGRVSGLFLIPPNPLACLVLAHGAGAGMTHPFMAALADGLAERGIGTLRYQFLYMERGRKRPDAPKLAQAVARAAVEEANQRLPGLPLFAGGKSFGGRMTSQAQATSALPGIRGLIFVGFPLHPDGHPSTERATHLFDIRVPLLFLQGSRDKLAELKLLRPLVRKLSPRATLTLLPEADHSFHVPARTGRKDADVLRELLDATTGWVKKISTTNPQRRSGPRRPLSQRR